MSPFIEYPLVVFFFLLQLFIEYFMAGNLPGIPYIEHVLEAWNLRHHPNMCFIFFEEMKKDLKSQIQKVATFLEKSYTDEQVEKLATHLHFDSMKANPFVNYDLTEASCMMFKGRGSFMREGKIGDWKNHFTPDMMADFDNWIAEKLKGTDLMFVWEISTSYTAHFFAFWFFFVFTFFGLEELPNPLRYTRMAPRAVNVKNNLP